MDDTDSATPEILIEVMAIDVTDPNLTMADSRMEELTRRAPEISRAARTIAGQLASDLRHGRSRTNELALDQAEFKFGLSLKAESGIVVLRGAAEATIEITLRFSYDHA